MSSRLACWLHGHQVLEVPGPVVPEVRRKAGAMTGTPGRLCTVGAFMKPDARPEYRVGGSSLLWRPGRPPMMDQLAEDLRALLARRLVDEGHPVPIMCMARRRMDAWRWDWLSRHSVDWVLMMWRPR